MEVYIMGGALVGVAFLLVFLIGRSLGGQTRPAEGGELAPPRSQPLPPLGGAPVGSPLGSPGAADDPARDPEVLAALAAGKKILAIKRYRELTGTNLKQAKEAVDALARGEQPPPAPAKPGAPAGALDEDAIRSDPQFAAALAAGQKIQAIKRYRELSGTNLRQAKDAVDRLF